MKKGSLNGSPRPLRRDDRPSSAGAVERVKSKEKRRSRTPPLSGEARHQMHAGSEAENSLPGDVIMPNHDIFLNEIPFNPPHPLDIKLMSGGPPGLEGDLVYPARHVGSGSHRSNGHHNSVENLSERLEVQTRELDEAKARAAQMEKTMRWWSDCTANWREKWGKVRAERNKAREEVRQLRIKLEAAVKECLILKRGKQETLNENEALKRQLLDLQKVVSSLEQPCDHNHDKPDVPERDPGLKAKASDLSKGEKNSSKTSLPDEKLQNSSSGNSSASSTIVCEASSDDKTEVQKSSPEVTNHSKSSPKKKNKSIVPSPEEEKLEQKAFMLQMKLEEASKTIQIERQEKDALHEEIGRIHQDLSSTKNQYEELVDAKEQLMKELSLMRSAHQQEVGRLTSDLEDEVNVRYSMDRRIADLRKELERLQSENAAEWGKRERLETEKLSLERELKKLRSQLHDLQESQSRKNRQVSSETEQKMKNMDDDINLKNKELVDLKHTFAKTKKLLQEKQDELEHTRKVAETNDAEVKRLRTRVDELKKSLAKSEDDFDQQGNQLRKVERNLDEAKQQCATLVTQVEHLQTRLRAQASGNTTPSKKRNTSYAAKGRFDGEDKDQDKL